MNLMGPDAQVSRSAEWRTPEAGRGRPQTHPQGRGIEAREPRSRSAPGRVASSILAGLLAFTFPVFADDSPVPPVKKPRKPAAAKVAADPQPLCFWTPVDPSPCACWFRTVLGAWEWNGCPAPPPVQFHDPICLWDPVAEEDARTPTCDCYYQTSNEEPAGAWAFKECPKPPPAAAVVREPAPFRLAVRALSMAGFSGEAERRVTYAGRVLADGPLANTWGKPARVFVDLDISALPGQTFNLGAEAFGRTAELRAGTYLTLAERWVGEQRITTSIVGWAGFATAIEGELRDRYMRSVGIGVRLAEETTGARIIVGWTRNEAAGYQGAGQVAVIGEAPIAGTNGALVIGGDALLGLSRASVTAQRDVLRLYMGASLGDIVDAVRSR